jgi:hypothetical protein
VGETRATRARGSLTHHLELAAAETAAAHHGLSC